ncbi:MAG: ATP-binding protein [Bacteroidales bacterium]|nr:ATP-binding protein [Bacteroidales bacterium]
MEIKRTLLDGVTRHLKVKEITVIAGARQVGKTTIIRELEQTLIKNGSKTIYLNLDFEPDFHYFSRQETLIQKLQLEFGNDHGYVFIDEIQRKVNAGIFLKGIYDLGLPLKFIVTGSGSMDIKAGIHESLAGRKRVFELQPVSFFEFANFKTDYRYERDINAFFALEKEKTGLMLEEYLNFGGYPRVVTEPSLSEKTAIINEIYNSYVSKDIAYLLKIDRPEIFKRMLSILAANPGSLLNLAKLSVDTGVSVPTIKKYLWIGENTFSIHEVRPFFKNQRKEITKSPVIYFNDQGFRNFITNEFGNISTLSRGFVFQNFIFNTLKSILQEIHAQIKFWRTTDQAEVDFIIDLQQQVIPVEVKYSSLQSTSLARSLRNFIEKYSPAKALVVNLSLSDTKLINSTLVHFVPYYSLPDFLIDIL